MSVTAPSSIIAVSQQDLKNPAIYNDKLAQACRMGFFFLEIPVECRPLLESAKKFGNNFYKDKNLREIKLPGFSGYKDRNTEKKPSQAESFYLERSLWPQIYSTEVQELGERLRTLAIETLRKSLEACQIPEEYWNIATGGASEGRGVTHLSFNHYRPEIAAEGLSRHADYGGITLLFTEQAGLHAQRGVEWPEVPTLENHLVVNFGQGLAIFVNNRDKLIAVPHFVRQVFEDRISFGVFHDHGVDKPIFKMEMPTAGQFYDSLFEQAYPKN